MSVKCSQRSAEQAKALMDAWKEEFDPRGELNFMAGVILRRRITAALDQAFAEGMEHGENLARLKRVHHEP